MFRIKTIIIATVAAAATALAPQVAHAAPDCQNLPSTKWKFTNISKSYKPTGLYSDWVRPKNARFTITYNQSATSATSATVSSKLSAEAGTVFVKAKAEVSGSLTKKWSKKKAWKYTASVKRNGKYKYRLRQRQETRKFTATKYSLYRGDCRYRKVKAGTAEMPRSTQTSLIWDVQKRKA
ncbi:hypothetical protein [Aeromicrobium duanguangcaii]|uniref:Uncharacterized protein n=1 Tax=Aeromicrobium duanguangcaii TaxID=2968086 RepID=A0ABY5KCX7_9ACTN|nr:hypothetical protein [Aeromicrobium duanguangcaii]MCD9154972.1 hypothetical protein [Aeromicrobium duanguangcaii]UUI67623.1 hypothetical protein NP095_10455 [Aeromicrobium duanguangcaii]